MEPQQFDSMTDWQQHFLTSLPRDVFEPVLASSTEDNGFTYDVRVQINGIEVGFAHFLEVLERNYEYAVNKEARVRIEEKFESLDTEVDELTMVVQAAKNRLALRAGVLTDDERF